MTGDQRPDAPTSRDCTCVWGQKIIIQRSPACPFHQRADAVSPERHPYAEGDEGRPDYCHRMMTDGWLCGQRRDSPVHAAPPAAEHRCTEDELNDPDSDCWGPAAPGVTEHPAEVYTREDMCRAWTEGWYENFAVNQEGKITAGNPYRDQRAAGQVRTPPHPAEGPTARAARMAQQRGSGQLRHMPDPYIRTENSAGESAAGRTEPHDYVSTACQHDIHVACRKTCKFCTEPCRCVCHLRAAGRTGDGTDP